MHKQHTRNLRTMVFWWRAWSWLLHLWSMASEMSSLRCETLWSLGDGILDLTVAQALQIACVMSQQRFRVSVNIIVFGINSGHGTSSSAGGSRRLSFGEGRPPGSNRVLDRLWLIRL